MFLWDLDVIKFLLTPSHPYCTFGMTTLLLYKARHCNRKFHPSPRRLDCGVLKGKSLILFNLEFTETEPGRLG